MSLTKVGTSENRRRPSGLIETVGDFANFGSTDHGLSPHRVCARCFDRVEFTTFATRASVTTLPGFVCDRRSD